MIQVKNEQGKDVRRRGRWMLPRYRHMFLLVTLSGSIALYALTHRAPAEPRTSHHPPDTDEGTFTIKTEGCTIPHLRPFDDKIQEIIKRLNANENGFLYPSSNSTSLILNNATHLWIQREKLPLYNATADDTVYCCYRAFKRHPPRGELSSVYSDRVQYEPCVYFSSHVEIMDEFVVVSCDYNYETIFEQFFVFTPLKQLQIDNSEKIIPNKSSYNVIVLGIDNVSRMNFYRTMPRTLAFLKKKGAVELRGYNKVGYNSFPNLIPMLLGVSESELAATCWSKPQLVHKCRFIWDYFRKVGYYTAFSDDMFIKLNVYNYVMKDYLAIPTDYYIQTFLQEADKYTGNSPPHFWYGNCCMGNKYFYKVILDYITNLFSTLKAFNFFGFFWETSISHDYLSCPRFMDTGYENFFKILDQNNHLDDSILVVISDHGMRWGSFRNTKQGRLEESLPLCYIFIPQSFRKKYSRAYENLKINGEHLTTPFDIYATLSDLLDLKDIENESMKLRSEATYSAQRGISLFLPIPSNRTCGMAGIDEHWCTCHRSVKLSASSEEAREAGAQLLRHVNLVVREHAQCAPLALAEVLDLTESLVGAPGEREAGWRELTVVVRAAPGGGLFEGTLRRDNRSWTPTGSVSRLDLYGDQSRCVSHQHLKLYCYCR